MNSDEEPSAEAGGDLAAPADDFIRVSEAKRRYFGGAMSLRWWYRQIEAGRLPHYRAGGTVLLRPADVEVFVEAGFREKSGGTPVPPPPDAPPPRGPTNPASPARRGGLRFFGS